MAELEQALGRLPDDPSIAPEPFPEIVARAERRRRRRWQARGLASVVAVAALAVGLTSILPEKSPQVVSSVNRPTTGDTALPPAVGRTTIAAPTTPTTAPPPIPSTTLPPEAHVVDTTVPDPDGSVSSPPMSDPPPTGLPGVDPSLSACPPADVVVTATTSKAVYARGETVTGFATLQNRSATACLVPARVRFAVQDPAGHDVSGFAYTADYALPIKADPGQSFSDDFTWDQTGCSTGPTCAQVPDGPYVAVGNWTEGGSFTARAPFQIGP